MTEEKRLDNQVISFIESKGGWCIKYWAGAKFTKFGVPDILACVDGQFFGIEDKSKKGKPTLLQIINLKKIRQAGGIGILLYPDEFDNFKRFINELFNNDNFTIWQKAWYKQNIFLQRNWEEKLK